MQRVNATDAARNFSDLINRAYYRHEDFVVVRNGEEVARILPPQAKITWSALVQGLKAVPWPDEDFAIDLEDIQLSQGALPTDPWDS